MELVDQVLFGNPFFYNIINYLSPGELLKLQKVHPIYYNISYNDFKKSIISEINNRLFNIFGKDLLKFKNIMKQTKYRYRYLHSR